MTPPPRPPPTPGIAAQGPPTSSERKFLPAFESIPLEKSPSFRFNRFTRPPGSREEDAQNQKLDHTECDLHRIRNFRFVTLRQECLDDPRPNQQQRHPADQRQQVRRNFPQPLPQRRSSAPPD